jgi:predicted anti-sigma-YlaC factor YlaD
MTCREAIALLSDYLETALSPEALQSLEDHLRDCRPCVAYLNTFRRTRELAATANRVEMPEEMKRRLHHFIRAQLRAPSS